MPSSTPESAWRRSSRFRRMPVIPVMIISAFVLLALAAGRLSPADPYAQSLRARLAPPVWAADGSWAPPLGPHRPGRALLSRIIFRARVSLTAGGVTLVVSGAVGAARR